MRVDDGCAGMENGKVLSDGGFNTLTLVTEYYRLLGDVFTSFLLLHRTRMRMAVSVVRF